MMTKWSLFQKCKVDLTFKNPSKVFPITTTKREKKYMIVSIDTGQAFGKIQHPFVIPTTLNNLEIEGSLLNLVEATACTVSMVKHCFSITSGTKQGHFVIAEKRRKEGGSMVGPRNWPEQQVDVY